MKFITLISCALPLAISAQTLVSTSPQQRTALIEEFTAINCGNCPSGHTTAASIVSMYGSSVNVIGIHGGPLSNPGMNQPDFRTADGTAIWNQFGIFSQPRASINRGSAITPVGWNTAVQNVLAQSSPVNIGVSSQYDPGSQMVLVEVELYYTGTGQSGDDVILVALTESNVIGFQQDYSNGAQANYSHKHVLRDMITPVAGDVVTTTSMGTLVQRNYSVAVDPSWNVVELDVVAYVGEQNGEVYQTKEVMADGGITTSVSEENREIGLGLPYPVPAFDALFVPISNDGMNTLNLVDSRGRVVRQQSVTNTAAPVHMDIRGLEAGVYFLRTDLGGARTVLIGR